MFEEFCWTGDVLYSYQYMVLYYRLCNIYVLKQFLKHGILNIQQLGLTMDMVLFCLTAWTFTFN